nr:ATP-binding protein [uncultured Desulfuromonas sp.]
MTKLSTGSRAIFLAKLSLPVSRSMVSVAVGCAGQVTQALQLDKTFRSQLELAVEEAFSNIVEHYSVIPGADDRIHVAFALNADTLVVSLTEKGMPFSPEAGPRYSSERLETMERPGLGTLLMSQCVDHVEFLLHGRQGKETRLSKTLTDVTIPEDLLPLKQPHKPQRLTVDDFEIHCPEEHELAEISRLAWKCYGYSQEELLYDLDLLKKKFRCGEYRPVVVIDATTRAMVMHSCLKYHDPNSHVPEYGLAFADPAYRVPRQAVRAMASKAFELARNNGADGVFDCSVTTHTASQKGMQVYCGSQPCSLFFAIAAAGMQARELSTSVQEKGSVINHYFAFNRTVKQVFCPPRHLDIMRCIYQWLELPREFSQPQTCALTGDAETDVFALPDELNVVFITVRKIGEQSVEQIGQALRDARLKRRHAVFVFIPLGMPAAPALVDHCEKMGFSFAGLMPHIHDGDDRILMQYVDCPVNLDAIRVYGDHSRQLFDYVVRELKEVGGR